VTPLSDIHLELYRLEQTRWSPTGFSAGADQVPQARRGLRARVGGALFGAGQAVAGRELAVRPALRHNRPVSAHR
jgi:hypothetical protein